MKDRGFSLIELIIFIVIMGIASVAILSVFQTVLKKSPTSNYQTTALGLAQERMELILGQRQLKGFSSFNDPCTSCTSLTGYTVTSDITSETISGDSNYKIITVTVSGLGDVTLKTLVGN